MAVLAMLAGLCFSAAATAAPAPAPYGLVVIIHVAEAETTVAPVLVITKEQCYAMTKQDIFAIAWAHLEGMVADGAVIPEGTSFHVQAACAPLMLPGSAGSTRTPEANKSSKPHSEGERI